MGKQQMREAFSITDVVDDGSSRRLFFNTRNMQPTEIHRLLYKVFRLIKWFDDMFYCSIQ